jgi:micrococcal nuclease
MGACHSDNLLGEPKGMTMESKTFPRALEECTRENTPKWNFNGLSAMGKVISVYDGDTVTIAFDTYGIGFFQHNVRLLGIDAPEIRGKSMEEKAAAIAARDHLRSLVLDKNVAFTVSSTDKYGRLLVSMYIDKMNVSEAMLHAGHAKPYDGGTREPYVSSE